MSTFLVNGADASLVSRALTDLLAELTGRDGPVLELETYEPAEESSGDEVKGRFDLGPVIEALSTPAWLSEHRVVVLRNAGALTVAQAGELGRLVENPPADNHLVIGAGGKPISATLVKAVRAAGGRVIDTDPPRQSRARNDWLDAHLSRAQLRLDAGARKLLADHIGEDAALLDPILDLVALAHPGKSRISREELQPYLGEAGSAPSWELTDAIDAGDGELSLSALHRLLGPGGRHPLQVLAVLNRHVSAMLRMDGATDVRSAEDAAAVLQMSPYPARKILEQSRKLGHERIVRAVEVLATADADLRGRLAWPPELVMEVAVARLAQLGRARARPGSRS